MTSKAGSAAENTTESSKISELRSNTIFAGVVGTLGFLLGAISLVIAGKSLADQRPDVSSQVAELSAQVSELRHELRIPSAEQLDRISKDGYIALRLHEKYFGRNRLDQLQQSIYALGREIAELKSPETPPAPLAPEEE